ncbi:phosphatase PAP2 family protein [Mucilaginibacter sp. X4EP1]|uniref:phosphatase PAP2 family protein n=1 Tax=Mucilaginibacter sp. X4EP1 TaxID=2723092 RepID=UPI00216A03FD|nr:phosphatase PAP2 family protein [Mucilaginibacter sp. X4EP1]MCS3816116.1 membrane-associated phospholipid phosphatase [Mucilaginibacter sp. X4EP1]
MKKVIFAILCFLFFRADAQVTVDTSKKNVVDTLKKNTVAIPDTCKKLHKSSSLSYIVPGVLVAYGVSSFVIHPVRRVDYYINDEIQKSDPHFHTNAETFFLFTPIAVVGVLDIAGVSGKNTPINQAALLGLSAGFFGVTDLVTKNATHRLRPNGTDYLSFPSGHTGAAFLGAQFLSEEYGDQSTVYTVIGYTTAVATGIFRMYNRDHWFSDVVAGAGLGILSTKAAYLVYPYLRNALTHKDKKGRSTMLIPTYQNGTAGLSFAMQL